MKHQIIVSATPDETSDDYMWEVIGPHEAGCQVWYECTKAWHRHPKNEWSEMTEWSSSRAPQEHQWIEGVWMVPGGTCGYDEADHGELYSALEKQQAAFGSRWEIAVEWEDWWFVTLLTQIEVPQGSSEVVE